MPSGPIWRFAAEPVSEKAIRFAERVLDVQFPADYRACVRDNGGGAPEPADFPLEGVTRRVGLLLSLDPGEDENVVGTAQRLQAEARLPQGLVPIINDGEGNYVCLDYGQGPPNLAYLTITGEVRPVAESFTKFLEMLK